MFGLSGVRPPAQTVVLRLVQVVLFSAASVYFSSALDCQSACSSAAFVGGCVAGCCFAPLYFGVEGRGDPFVGFQSCSQALFAC